MNKKKLKILGIIIAFAICFPLHFLYDKFPNFITSIFSPVNESIWEHMKIIFGSIILSGIFQKIIIKIKKENFNNVCFSNFIAAITSIPIYLIMFLPLNYLLGESMFIAITIMLITIIIAEYISYKIMNKDDKKLEKVTILFITITYIIFTILSYKPLKIDIFKDPKTNTYGIQKR